jgi:hypothetical protein
MRKNILYLELTFKIHKYKNLAKLHQITLYKLLMENLWLLMRL